LGGCGGGDGSGGGGGGDWCSMEGSESEDV